MDIEVQVNITVTIPDERLLGLAAKVREKWDKQPTEAVHVEDLLHAAVAAGVAEINADEWSAPSNWNCVDDWEATDEELVATHGATTKSARQRDKKRSRK